MTSPLPSSSHTRSLSPNQKLLDQIQTELPKLLAYSRNHQSLTEVTIHDSCLLTTIEMTNILTRHTQHAYTLIRDEPDQHRFTELFTTLNQLETAVSELRHILQQFRTVLNTDNYQ